MRPLWTIPPPGFWIPAFAGMTVGAVVYGDKRPTAWEWTADAAFIDYPAAGVLDSGLRRNDGLGGGDDGYRAGATAVGRASLRRATPQFLIPNS